MNLLEQLHKDFSEKIATYPMAKPSELQQAALTLIQPLEKELGKLSYLTLSEEDKSQFQRLHIIKALAKLSTKNFQKERAKLIVEIIMEAESLEEEVRSNLWQSLLTEVLAGVEDPVSILMHWGLDTPLHIAGSVCYLSENNYTEAFNKFDSTHHLAGVIQQSDDENSCLEQANLSSLLSFEVPFESNQQFQNLYMLFGQRFLVYMIAKYLIVASKCEHALYDHVSMNNLQEDQDYIPNSQLKQEIDVYNLLEESLRKTLAQLRQPEINELYLAIFTSSEGSTRKLQFRTLNYLLKQEQLIEQIQQSSIAWLILEAQEPYLYPLSGLTDAHCETLIDKELNQQTILPAVRLGKIFSNNQKIRIYHKAFNYLLTDAEFAKTASAELFDLLKELPQTQDWVQEQEKLLIDELKQLIPADGELTVDLFSAIYRQELGKNTILRLFKTAKDEYPKKQFFSFILRELYEKSNAFNLEIALDSMASFYMPYEDRVDFKRWMIHESLVNETSSDLRKILINFYLNHNNSCFVQSATHFLSLLKLLKPEEHGYFIEKADVNSMQLLNIPQDFVNLIKQQSEEDVTLIFQIFKDKLVDIMRSADDFVTTIDCLPARLQTDLYRAVKDKLPEFVQTTADFITLMQRLDRETEGVELYKATKYKILPTCSKYNLRTYLTNENFIELKKLLSEFKQSKKRNLNNHEILEIVASNERQLESAEVYSDEPNTTRSSKLSDDNNPNKQVIDALEAYCEIRRKEKSLHWSRRMMSFFSKQAAYSSETKINAAEKCIKCLGENAAVEFTPDELKALKDGRLKGIIGSVKSALIGTESQSIQPKNGL